MLSISLYLLVAVAYLSCTNGGNAADYDKPTEKSGEEITAYFNIGDLNNVTAPEVGLSEGNLISKLSEHNNYLGNLMELGPYFKGNILRRTKRNGLRPQSKRWPDGKIPYVFTDEFAPKDMALFYQAFKEFHQNTCIYFIPRINQPNYLSITRQNTGCNANSGYSRRGAQKMNIKVPGCNTKGIIMHELMHVVGFLHEQSRGDRDDYVHVHMQNIKEKHQHNYKKKLDLTSFGIPYDYNSIMHYGPNSFSSRKGLITMTPLQALNGAVLGQHKGFSESDIRKINRMYNCRNYFQ